ncbi:hypothetical protein A3A21_03920 [Candidatus Jorgensenbacteria bacterium RIFCSPLOWO2_01_FULL_45_25b]|uniref:Uncharacterized protein n=1 Tax=Candidatus Jorgensenbacteria bacterium RIFCSPLOWO2_01_FULL_45_25b TaxID=1798471 RepID=A0A1F6BWF3_9BACT|nr:MAG: hypothetical protein A3A21_03920 [Candidatus Jorgensenbacteria bacterium RIFCSPLOWO2_01_FULL_45_25b]
MRTKKSGLFALIISIIVVVGAGALGYFFVFPLFYGTPPPDVSENTTPTPPEAPALEVQEEVPLDGQPANGLVPAITPTSSQPAPTSAQQPSLPTRPSHVSYLISSLGAGTPVTLGSLSLNSIRSALGFGTASTPSLKEVLLQTSQGSVLFPSLAKLISPELFTEELLSYFETDFTLAIYTNAQGSWPVYVLKALSAGDSVLAKQDVSRIETVNAATLGNFFLTSPGGTGMWQDGKVIGTSGRYTTFTQSGAALNYVWFDSYLLIGTNYSAIQETAKKLGS